MLTNRQAINQLRDSLKERNSDSTQSNQFLFRVLHKHAKWLIRRDASSGRIFRSSSLFQTLGCFDIIETSPIDGCCEIQTKCKVYRTAEKIPAAWEGPSGLMIKEVKSIDGSHIFSPTTPAMWTNIEASPYFKYNKANYYFYSNGYLFFPVKAPRQINIIAYFMDDVSTVGSCCKDTDKCLPFLDRTFRVPDWLEGEVFAKALEELAGVTKRLPEDEQLDANPTRKS